jgi:hypothetical protein
MSFENGKAATNKVKRGKWKADKGKIAFYWRCGRA